MLFYSEGANLDVELETGCAAGRAVVVLLMRFKNTWGQRIQSCTSFR